MVVDPKDGQKKEYKKAKDLTVVIKYEIDKSPEGQMRFDQTRDIICQLIYLGMKKGRPAKVKEELDEAA